MHQICLPPFFLYAAFLYNIYFHFKLSLYFQHPVFGVLHKAIAYGRWLRVTSLDSYLQFIPTLYKQATKPP